MTGTASHSNVGDNLKLDERAVEGNRGNSHGGAGRRFGAEPAEERIIHFFVVIEILER